ncbi:MAG: sulfatase [Chloroflexota bacterium]|nr:MAG: sulfatase [Chloroflexota bacterium]
MGERRNPASGLAHRDGVSAESIVSGAATEPPARRQEGRPARRPNFLVFVTDEQRADHLGCAGNRVVLTPNIDDLARRGVRFDRCYVNNPLCQPARATLFTGLTARGHGVRTNGIPLNPAIPTMPDALRRGGYRTHAVGKLHLRNYSGQSPGAAANEAEMDHALESRAMWQAGRIGSLPPNYEGLETTDFAGQHGPLIFGDYLTWLRGQDPDGPRLLTQAAGDVPASGAEESWTMALPADLHYNTWVAERTIAFLRRQRGSERPFFLWCSFPDPHYPYCPPRPWADIYRPEAVALPNRRDGELDDLPPHFRMLFEGTGGRVSGRRNATRIRDDQMRDIIALTYGMVSMVDHEVGRVMAEVDRLGLRDDTVVVLLSDHGDMMGDHWMLHKGPFHFDGLLRTPMIWSWPGRFAEGSVVGALVGHLDFAPTVLDVAGVPIPEGTTVDPPIASEQPPPWPGVSLAPLLMGEATQVHEQLIVENDEDYLGLRVRTLVTEQFQITAYPGQPYGELFDRASDPMETRNFWGDASYEALKKDLLVRLMEEIVLTDSALPRRTATA